MEEEEQEFTIRHGKFYNSITFDGELRWENGMHSLCRRWYMCF
jgi:hypothetical protein